MERIEKEIKVTKYVANDGKEFDTEHECRMYECSELGELMGKLNSCIVGTFTPKDIPLDTCFGYEKFYVIMPRTRNDYYVANRILELGGCNDRIPGGGDYKMYVIILDTDCNIIKYASVVDMDAWVRSVSNNKFTVVTMIKDSEDERKASKSK